MAQKRAKDVALRLGSQMWQLTLQLPRRALAGQSERDSWRVQLSWAGALTASSWRATPPKPWLEARAAWSWACPTAPRLAAAAKGTAPAPAALAQHQGKIKRQRPNYRLSP